MAVKKKGSRTCGTCKNFDTETFRAAKVAVCYENDNPPKYEGVGEIHAARIATAIKASDDICSNYQKL